MIAFCHLPGCLHDFARNALPCTGVFENHFSLGGETLVHQNDGAVRVDAQRSHIERLRLTLQGHVKAGAYA